ncbi:hypothetical protein B0H16DRAFT_1595240 [Mycena metata]|uniref:Fungal-type protein kinase domain-containing protein n=1 Tax=Mycena metata TaxID=1033252 RepID=A0AAD7HP70_9AGAR|nr:hypothetical protein B0H16DRAFT_1595240 [Mycena metata]
MSSKPKSPPSQPRSPPVSSSTPIKPSSKSSNDNHQPDSGRSQADLIRIMRDEIGGQAYQFPDATRISRILSPRTPKNGMAGAKLAILDNYDCVVDAQEFQTAFTAAEAALEAAPKNLWHPWPNKPPSPERNHYGYFGEFLNACIHFGGDALPKLRGSWYDELNFVVYDRVMGDTVGKASPVKPDLLGGNGLATLEDSEDSLQAKDTLFWSPRSDQSKMRAEIPVEVKDNWPELISQAATYARCLFSANPSRTFALVIGYNQTGKRGGFRFLLFHRGGLTSHVPLLLNTREGRADALRLMMTLLLWSNPRDAGFVSTSNELDFWIPRPSNPQKCIKATAKQILHNTNCVRGRATRVSRLSCEAPDAGVVSSAGVNLAPVSQATVVRRRSPRLEAKAAPSPPTSAPRSRKTAGAQPAKSEELSAIPVKPRERHPKHHMEWSPPAGLTNGSQPNVQVVEGQDVVLKASWQTESSKNVEKSMYMAGAGAFGTAVVLYSYEATHPTGEPVSNCLLVPTQQEMSNTPTHPWTIGTGGASENEPPEIRDLCITVFLSIGQSLYEANSSYDICIGICDLSLIGNVLLTLGQSMTDKPFKLEDEILKPLWPPASVDGTTIALNRMDITTGSPSQTSAQIGKDIITLVEKLKIGSKCTAFVADGDMSMKWSAYFDNEHTHATREPRSSCRLNYSVP